MCGISGVFSSAGLNDQQITAAQQALDTLQHRGPDHSGHYRHSTIFMGHQRLSVIDLNPQSHQPFYSACGRYVIVFNGEVYNYKELIEKFGLRVRTSSDTEVVIELYALLKEKALHELEGMFAFCIYDRQENEVFVARDRCGIKPLFYCFEGGRLSFASELKAFKYLCPQEVKKIDRQSIYHFLHLGFVPAPGTIFQEVRKLLPGHFLRIKGTEMTIERYFDHRSPQAHHEITVNELTQIIEGAVKKQLVADVPVGCFLSGGIDSSLVTAIAQKHYPGKIQTFTIGFSEKEKNEARYAAEISQLLGTEHTEHFFSEKDALDITEKAMDQYDEPFSDSSAIPTYLLSKITAAKVKVALSGDGGDELFLGYGAYRWAKRLSKNHLHYSRGLLKMALGNTGQRNQRASWIFDYKNRQHIHSHIFSQEQYLFSEKELERMLQALYRGDQRMLHAFNHFDTGRPLHFVEKQQQFDLRYYLPDDLLTKVDRASMAHSLEVRVPLLDEDLVRAAQNIHYSKKMQAGELKFLLKQALGQYIPRKYFDRPKQGFSVPLAKWLKSDLQYLVDQFLDDAVIEKYGIVDKAAVKKMRSSFESGNTIWYNKIWALMLLHRWLVKAGF